MRQCNSAVMHCSRHPLGKATDYGILFQLSLWCSFAYLRYIDSEPNHLTQISPTRVEIGIFDSELRSNNSTLCCSTENRHSEGNLVHIYLNRCFVDWIVTFHLRKHFFQKHIVMITVSEITSESDFQTLAEVEDQAFGESPLLSLLFKTSTPEDHKRSIKERIWRHTKCWKEDPACTYLKATTDDNEIVGMGKALWCLSSSDGS